MKKIFLLGYLLSLYISPQEVLRGQTQEVLRGQRGYDNTIESLRVPINIPDIQGAQTLRTLIRLKPYQKDKALTLVDSELRYLPIDESDNRQLWWIIQDHKYHAFAFSNASNTNQWLYYDSTTDSISMAANDKKVLNDSLLGEYIEKQYFFEFEFFDTGLDMPYAIRNTYSKTYLQTTNIDSEYSNWRLEIDDFIPNNNALFFDFDIFEANQGEFVYLPLSETDDHVQEEKENQSLSIRASDTITSNKAYVSSSYGFLQNSLGGEDMFKITFDSLVTESSVGLLHYKSVPFSNSFYQKQGSRKLIAGIRVKGDTICLFNKNDVLNTSFHKGIPIIFGYRNGELIASQSNHSDSIDAVPTPTLLNSRGKNRIKLLMHLPYGTIDIGYNPNLLLFGKDFRGKDSASFVMTNPLLSALENTERYKAFDYAPKTNPLLSALENKEKHKAFDYTTKTYDLRYKEGGEVVHEKALSPFYYEEEEFSAIAAKYTPGGKYIGGEDFNYYEGWELIVHDFGYDQLGNPKMSSGLRRDPYMILYNRYYSKLRIFVYVNNPTIANNIRITISDDIFQNGVLEQYKTPRLWGSYLQGRALNDPELSTEEYSKMMHLNSTTTGNFYFADFTLTHDPCVREYESNIRISVSSITQGDLEIVGRTKGGVIPVNSPAISDWLSNSSHYLTGILNTPYGELNSTLGDITFRNFSKWGTEQWKNTASFILPGEKVEAWEREAARLEYQGQSTITSGEFLSGAGLIISGTAQLATAADITHISTSIAEGVGTLMDAAGTLLSASGSALIAKSLQLQYENLEDEPDKNITVTLPDPQPSIVFSELAARGTLSIETNMFSDIVITTPGSKYSEIAPNDHQNESKGSYPLYNEPLGVYNMLYQPEIALSIVRQSKDIGGYIRLKTPPYLITNGTVDYMGGFFTVNYVVTTYADSLGYSTTANRSKSFLLPNRKVPGVIFLPMRLDISELIDKKTLLNNIRRYQQNSVNDSIERKINDWITVDLEVEFFGFTDKNNYGTYGVADLSNSYKSKQESRYEDATGVDEDISSLLVSFSDLSFQDTYSGEDLELWEGYIVGPTTDNYSEKIYQYCGVDDLKALESIRLDTIDKNAENRAYKALSSVGTSEFTDNKAIHVYPNPSDGIFTIEYLSKEKGKVELQVYDSNGNLLVTHTDYVSVNHLANKATIDISGLRSGIYFLKVSFESGDNYSRKLIKN